MSNVEKTSGIVKNNESLPHVISLCLICVACLATIALGYFHGNMHLLTTLKNAYTS